MPLTAIAVANYRSLRDLVVPLAQLTVVTGENGSGKSNLYRALRLLADAAHDRLIASLAQEGGLASTLWAGPERLSAAMRRGEAPVQGTVRRSSVSLALGFQCHDFGYALDCGLPISRQTAFALDPEIKRECIWAGPVLRPASLLVDRRGAGVRVRASADASGTRGKGGAGRKDRAGGPGEIDGTVEGPVEGAGGGAARGAGQGGWQAQPLAVRGYDSVISHALDPRSSPEALALRERLRHWRFYDQLRSDRDSPARQPRIGTRTPALADDGRDLAAALQTIVEIGDHEALAQAIDDAFPGASVSVTARDGRFELAFHQPGLLRPLGGAELSDGTLRYLLWTAALLSPRPPELMVLNEPETSLHPDLMPALGRLVATAARHSQLLVVTHSNRLAAALDEIPDCLHLTLARTLGATELAGGDTWRPRWQWPAR